MSYVLTLCAVYHYKKRIAVRNVPIFGRIKDGKQFIPTGIIAKREYNAVYVLRFSIVKERLRILGIAKIALENAAVLRIKRPSM